MPFTQAGGVRIAYDVHGSGDAVVFLHGVGSTRAVWAGQLEAFSRGYRAVALDFRGHGDSEVPETMTREAYARDINAVLDALQAPRAHLVGLSMGGVAAMQFALDFPARVRTLTLANTFAYYPAWHSGKDERLAAIDRLSMREIAESRGPLVLAPDAPAERLRWVVEAMAAKDKRGYRLAQEPTWGGDFRDVLGRFQAPTLVLVGDRDTVTPVAQSEELAAGIPGAKLVVIPGAGHLSNLDQPEAFNTAVREFIGAH